MPLEPIFTMFLDASASSAPIDCGFWLSIIAIVVSVLSALFTGWQTYLHKQELDGKKERDFLERLKNHYHDMNEQVFRPLSNLRAQMILSRLTICKYDAEDNEVEPYDPFKTYLWSAAEKHILKDHREEMRAMPKLIRELQNKIDAYNEQASKLRGVSSADAMSASSGKTDVSLAALDIHRQMIEDNVANIRHWFSLLSDSIEYDQYDLKADCCPKAS